MMLRRIMLILSRGRRRRRRTRVNQRVTNDVGINPPSKLSLHRPLQRFISIEGTASLEDTLEDPEACQNIVLGILTQRVNLIATS
eukprot:4819257-Pyramimonas_sp.AAC.1